MHYAEQETEQNRHESRQKVEEVQSALRDATSQLQSVEKERRDAKTTLEQYQEDVRVLHTIIDEEQAKAKSEIKDILSEFRQMEKTILYRQEQFDLLLRV